MPSNLSSYGIACINFTDESNNIIQHNSSFDFFFVRFSVIFIGFISIFTFLQKKTNNVCISVL